MSRFAFHAFALLLALVTVSVFWPAQNYDFIWDDRVNVTENPYLKGKTLSDAVEDVWKRPYKKLYIPVTYTVWAVLAQFAAVQTESGNAIRLDPRLFHLGNIALHLLNVLLVFIILRRLVPREWAAAAGALMFGIHPVQVEPVAWITGMKDIVAGLLSLVALWQYLLHTGRAVAPRESGYPKGIWHLAHASGRPIGLNRCYCCYYGVATIAFLLALLAKPTAVVVPVMAWVLDYGLLRRPLRQWAVPLAIWGVISLPFVLLTKWTQPDAGISFVTPSWERPIVAVDAIAFYLYKLIFPLWLAPDYGRTPAVVLHSGWSSWTWGVPLAFFALVWWQKRPRPWLFASAGLFVVGLFPVLGLVPFNFQNFSTVADRYLYVSLLGPALALSWSLSEGWGKRWGIAVCALALGCLAARSALQVQHWRDAETLFRHVLRVNPASWTAHYNLGNALERRGEMDEAVRHYRETLRIVPHARAHNNLGIALEKRGEMESAVEHYRGALAVDPTLAEAQYNLGSALARGGNLEEAVRHFREAIRLQPDFAVGHESLARALALQGKREEAIHHMEEAVRIMKAAPQS